MQKRKKIIIWVVAIVAVLFIGHLVIDSVAKYNLNSALAKAGTSASVSKVHVGLIRGELDIMGVDFELADTTGIGQEIKGHLDAIKLKHLHWESVFRGVARADRLSLIGPQASLILAPKAAKQEEAADTTKVSAGDPFFKEIFLDALEVKNGSVDLRSRGDSLKVSVKDFSISVDDIGYSLAKSCLEYNDSTYSVAIDSLDYIDAPGLSRIIVGHLATANAGAIKATGMHMYNCVPQEQLAERMGKVASMWYDVTLDSLYVSDVNIPRLIKEKNIAIDSVHVSSPGMTLLQDDRYPPAVPYATIQESLNTVEMPLHIKKIDGNIGVLKFIWETTHVNRGTFPLHNIHLALKSVGNAPGNLMEVGLSSGKKGGASMKMSLCIKNDTPETTYGKMLVKNLEAESLDPFIRTLFGATAKADFKQIDFSFKGDKTTLTSDFCMLYENLSVKAWDDSTAPFKFVSSNSGLVTFLANLVLPKANPTHPDAEPKRVEVTVKRDPMQPYPAYIIQCMTMGMLHTVLPGGKIHKAGSTQKR